MQIVECMKDIVNKEETMSKLAPGFRDPTLDVASTSSGGAGAKMATKADK